MSETIDKKIVEMGFENQQFEKGVSTSVASIDKLKKSLNFEGAEKGFAGITNAAGKVHFNPIADGLNALTSKFNALGIIGITTLVNLTNAALNAGKRMVSALTIDPIKTGLNEYETKLNSVQTILANTQKEGTDLKTVTKALNELNDYSDKTIYNFQQMTRNVGTFTAAGVSLDASVAAIKGIANLAAISGSNADQASTAMYQLSQALSTGTVRLMDWNSVVNAGMGGQVFQDAIKETARVHGVAVDQIIEEEGSFRDSLQKGWLTSEILTETLQKFTGDLNEDQLRTMGYSEEQIASIIKLGQTANDAATKVKTFSQLFSTLKEAAQSGWAQTWEIIIGDFEEAKTFLTELNNWFGAILGASADARNQLLQGWKDLGGRTKMIEAFQNVLNAIVAVLNPIRDAMREIFPPTTAKQLMAITTAVADFTKRLIISGDTIDTVKRIFKGIFALLDIGRMAVVAIAKEFGRLVGKLSGLPGGLGDILAKLGDFIVRLRDMIKANDTFGKAMRAVGDAILAIAAFIGGAVNSIIAAVDKFKTMRKSEGFLKSFSAAISTFLAFFKQFDFGVIQGFIDRLKARIGEITGLGKFLNGTLGKTNVTASPFVKKLMEIRETVVEAIKKFASDIFESLKKIDFRKFDFSNIFDDINKGLLAGLLLAITKFVTKGGGLFDGITNIFSSVTGFVNGATGILTSISSILTGTKDVLVAWQQQIRAGTLMKIASAVGILAVALIALSLVDPKKLTAALAAITGLFADLMGSLAIYEKMSGTGSLSGLTGVASGVTAMLGLAGAVLILSGALVKVSKIPEKDILKGILAIVALTAVMVVASKVMSTQTGTIIKGAGSLVIFSLALRALIKPVQTLGNMDMDALVKGLIGLGALLAEVSLFMKATNFRVGDLEDVLGLLILSAAINVLSKVIQDLGKLDASTLTQGLTVMGVLLVGLAGFSKVASGGATFMLTAAAILVLSGALTVIAGVIQSLGKMSWDQLGVALVALAGSLLIFVVALNAMNGAMMGAASLLIAAAALALMVPPLKALGSMSLEQVGIGLLALAGAFTVIGVAGALITPILPSLLLLGAALLLLGASALAVGVGVAAFAAGLATLVAIGGAGGVALVGVLTALASVLPILAIAFGKAIIAFANTIKNGAPVLFEAGAALLKGFIKSFTDTIPEIVIMVMNFMTTLLTSIAERLPEIVQAGYDILIGFLSGIRDNIGQVVTVSIDIMNAYLNAIAAKIPEIVDSGWNLIIAWIDGLRQGVEEHLPVLIKAVQKLGIAIVKGLVAGLISANGEARQGIIDIANMIINSFKEALGINSPSTVFITLAGDIVAGIIQGLKAKISEAVAIMAKLADDMVKALKGKASSMIQAGRDLVNGFAQGIKGYIGVAVAEAAKLAAEVLKKIKSVLGIQSPSKELMEVGMFTVMGFVEGIDKYGARAVTSIEEMGKTAVQTFTDTLGTISSAINSDMNLSPTVTPVVDMTNIQTGSKEMQKLFDTNPLNMSVAAKSVNGVTTGQPGTTTTEPTQPQGSTVSFTQINNSPKALDRIEIYRQTRRQLWQAKEMVGG